MFDIAKSLKIFIKPTEGTKEILKGKIEWSDVIVLALIFEFLTFIPNYQLIFVEQNYWYLLSNVVSTVAFPALLYFCFKQIFKGKGGLVHTLFFVILSSAPSHVVNIFKLLLGKEGMLINSLELIAFGWMLVVISKSLSVLHGVTEGKVAVAVVGCSIAVALLYFGIFYFVVNNLGVLPLINE